MAFSDELSDGDLGTFVELLTTRVTVNGTTFMAEYEVLKNAVLLASADFGEGMARLDGLAPATVAARLLQGMAQAAMARSDVHHMRDDEANSQSA